MSELDASSWPPGQNVLFFLHVGAAVRPLWTQLDQERRTVEDARSQCGIRGAVSEVRDQRCGIRGAGSEVRSKLQQSNISLDVSPCSADKRQANKCFLNDSVRYEMLAPNAGPIFSCLHGGHPPLKVLSDAARTRLFSHPFEFSKCDGRRLDRA
ncbi:hypothetical protein BIW11_10577 [Tropilaelaps mercedesae]|uniref:Uncharacterized protein n=1 Tax=Tropilaelaps mercedesae TaxID=418985 RepID=A0A1V9XFJ7_9ACAR|nr:hypothetical protein BIW11_10577 [Tropilaelaps mercedesae]